ncbi:MULTISPECIES: hypothetical protein [Virgibacillus]
MSSDFEKSHEITKGYVSSAQSRLFSVKDAVDYAEMWLTSYDRGKNRGK